MTEEEYRRKKIAFLLHLEEMTGFALILILGLAGMIAVHYLLEVLP